MPGTKQKIERFFEVFTSRIYDNPIKTLTILFLFLGYMFYMSTQGTIDSSAEAMFRENDPTMQEYRKFLDQFGHPELVFIGIKSDNIFQEDFLKKLKAFQNEISENVPYLKKITSLITARNTRGENDTLIVEPLLEDWPEKPVDFSELKKQVMSNPYYANNILSQDGRMTALVVEFEASAAEEDAPVEENLFDEFDGIDDTTIKEASASDSEKHLTEKEFAEISRKIYPIVARYNQKDFSIAVSGGIIIADVYNKTIAKDQTRCFMISMMSAVFFMLVLFRRVTGVIFPGIIVLSAVYATTGMMALLNKPMNELSIVIQPFLITVGVADAVHVLTIFYRNLQQTGDKKSAIVQAMGHSGLAIVLTSLTTAAGLFSFAVSNITAIAEMGIFSGVGVILALLFTLIMLPALPAIIPIKQKKNFEQKASLPVMDHVLRFFTDISTSHPKKILTATIILFLVSFYFIFRLDFSHYPLNYLPDTLQIKKDVMLIDREFKGVTSLEVVIDTGKENGLYEPDMLNRIENLSKALDKYNTPDLAVGKVISINDILKETNRALHDNNPEFYSIPQDRKTIAQEFLLFENSGSEDLYQIVDRQFSKTRFTIKVPNADALVYRKFIHDVEQLCHNIFADQAKITLTGITVLIARTIPIALTGMAESYAIAFIVITLMMIFLLGSFKIGLASMVPNLLPIAMVMGIMGLKDIPLNLTTMMIGSIAIGLVVDDTVHFMYNFQKYFNQTRNTYDAVRHTLLSTGRAMLITSLILSSGFFVLMLAILNHMVRFGFFTGLTVVLALLADFLVAPALVTLLVKDENSSSFLEKGR